MALFHFKQSLPVNNTGFGTDYKTERNFESQYDTDIKFEPVCRLERKFESVRYPDRKFDSVYYTDKKFESACDSETKFKPFFDSDRKFESNWHTDRKFNSDSNFRCTHDKNTSSPQSFRSHPNFTDSTTKRNNSIRKEQDWDHWREGYRKEETGHRDRRILLQGVDLGLVLTQTIHKETVKIQQEKGQNMFHMSGS